MSILPDPDADALGDIRDTTGRPLAAALPCPPCLDAIARGVAPVHLPPAQHTGGPVRILTWGQTPDGRPILRVQDIPGDDGEPLTPLREAIGPPRPPSPPDRPRRGPRRLEDRPGVPELTVARLALRIRRAEPTITDFQLLDRVKIPGPSLPAKIRKLDRWIARLLAIEPGA